jgi:hypothetical protein
MTLRRMRGKSLEDVRRKKAKLTMLVRSEDGSQKD